MFLQFVKRVREEVLWAFTIVVGALRRSATYSLAPESGYLIVELDIIRRLPCLRAFCGSNYQDRL